MHHFIYIVGGKTTSIIKFYDDEENIHNKSCLLEKEDYEKWEFDSYLYNYIKEMMHLFF